MGNDTWTWQPEIVPLQLVQIGDVILIGVPGEIASVARILFCFVIKLLMANDFKCYYRNFVICDVMAAVSAEYILL